MLDEDQLLRKIGRTARRDEEASREAFGERWEALAAGRLSEVEMVALREEAAASHEGRRAWEAFRPLGAECREALISLRRVSTRSGSATAELRDGSRRAHPGFVFKRWYLPAALAAGFLLLLLAWPEEQILLPAYHLAVSGGIRDERAPADSEGRPFGLESLLQLTLIPETARAGEVRIALFVAGHGGDLHPLSLPDSAVEAEPTTGAVSVLAEVGQDLGLTAGEWTLIAVVARPGGFPSLGELRRERRGEIAPSGWQRYEQSVQVLP